MRVENGISGTDEENDAAKLNRISARRGFPDGDPRAGPFDQKQVDEARHYLSAADRWSPRVTADLYAVRLQYGRGVGRRRAAAMFGVSDGMIAVRKELPWPRKWIDNMSDRDRCNLARHVWLGGLLRQIESGNDPDAVLAALHSASEWKSINEEEELIFVPQDERGEIQTMTVHREIADDAYYTDNDPYRDERIAMLAKLESEHDAIDALRDEDSLGENAGEIGEASEARAGDESLPQSE
jgi:hypothetical protein